MSRRDSAMARVHKISVIRPVPVVVQPVAVTTVAPRVGGLPLFAICCLALTLLTIAATIILSLIPVYTRRQGGVLGTTARAQYSYALPSTTVLTTGPLNDNQKSILQNALQQYLNQFPEANGATVTVLSADGVGPGTASGLNTAVSVTCTRSVACRLAALRLLRNFKISPDLLQQLVAAQGTTTLPGATATTTVMIGETTTSTVMGAATTTTVMIGETTTSTVMGATTATTVIGTTTTTMTMTTTTITNTTSNTTLVIGRRSLKEGGLPASMVYIDSHQIASKKGNVSSVSFYIDRSCALATVEFGAFELISRNTDANTAQLVLTHRSGPLKLAAASKLKPYMNLITIRLCNGKIYDDLSAGGCQGSQFPVLPHQYIGLRSDTCRVGYAEPIPNSPMISTWTHIEGFDSFAQPYETLNYVPAPHAIIQKVTIDSSESTNDLQINEQSIDARSRPRVLFVGSFPPRECGLAKFLEDLTDNYKGPHSVVAVDEQQSLSTSRTYSEKVVYRLNQTDRNSYYAVADLINSHPYDVVNIQHEYGLYGGLSGEYILVLLGAIRKPIITTMHTIIPDPGAFYLSLTRAIAATSTKLVVLSPVGRRLLVDVYGIDESKISVVFHGVPDVPFTHSLSNAKTRLGFEEDVPIIATFGLLSRNKNIQLALKALPSIVESVPKVVYLIIGQTHPLVKLTEGETYRQELQRNATELGISENVRFIDKYVDDSELLGYLNIADVYLTPYAREDQYVSGTLSWAVGMGKAVVSTPYLYAKELLADGRGFLVPFEDHNFLGSTITDLLKDDEMRNIARHRAYKYGRRMTWSNVANELEDIFREILLFT